MALIKLGLIYSYYFKATPIPIQCISRVTRNNKELVFKQYAGSGTSSSFEEHGSAGRIGKSISAKLGFTQMLRAFRFDPSNAYISISNFVQRGPFSQVQSHKCIANAKHSIHFKHYSSGLFSQKKCGVV